MRHRREPIPARPFLEWCATREEQIRRDLDSLPALTVEGDFNPQARLLMEIGWGGDHGARRWYRWRHENTSGLVERADVEDALDHAGVQFCLIYPLEAEADRSLRIRLGEQRHMTDEQVIAAHTVYAKGQMTTTSLAAIIYEQFGYATVASCAKALSVAFRGLGLTLRQCIGETPAGARCRRTPMAESDYCPEHARGRLRPSHVGGRRSALGRTARAYHPTPDLIEQARMMHLHMGMTWRHIGYELLCQTPWTSPDHLAQRLAAVAHRQGWHKADRIGRPRNDMDRAAA